MLLSVWNEQALQFWAVIAAGAVIIWAYYTFWKAVINPWVKTHFTEGRK
jgi:hypothetical protein